MGLQMAGGATRKEALWKIEGPDENDPEYDPEVWKGYNYECNFDTRYDFRGRADYHMDSYSIPELQQAIAEAALEGDAGTALLLATAYEQFTRYGSPPPYIALRYS